MAVTLRKVHIDDRQWKWYIRGSCAYRSYGNLVVFSPNGKRHEISREMWEPGYDRYRDEENWPNITPGQVTKYIKEHLQVEV